MTTTQATEKPKRIVRATHDKDNPYFLMARATAQDEKLSFEARGLLVYVLSKPDHWQVRIGDLKKQGMGRDKAYRVLNELRGAGYIEVNQERVDGKFSTNTWLIHETPFTENPYTVLPDADLPDTENPQLDNTEYSDTIDSVETTEDTLAADAAPDVSSVPKQQKPKPKSTAPKPRSEYPEPDAVYEAVERHVFEIEGTPDMPYDWKGHCGYITKWLKGEIAKWNIHEFGKISAPASPEHVERFIKWYREERKGTPLPTTPATFVKNWRQWATALKAVAPKPAAQQHTNVRENWTPERQAELERREAETKRRMAERLGKPEGRPA